MGALGGSLFHPSCSHGRVFESHRGLRPRVGSDAEVVRTLGPGEYFGEMALLGRHPRSAGTRALTALDVLVLPGSDFSALADTLTEFRGQFEQIAHARSLEDAERAQRSASGAT